MSGQMSPKDAEIERLRADLIEAEKRILDLTEGMLELVHRASRSETEEGPD